MSAAALACPCGLPAVYARCCGRWHSQGAQALQAPDAQTLMRSRYSAFVVGDWAYLLATWHPSTRPAQLEPEPEGVKWLGLQIKHHERLDETHATVEFVARSRLHGRAQRLHEKSRFERVDGQWFYVDGEFP